MPQNVYMGKDGVLVEVSRTGDNAFDKSYLGSCQDWELTVSQDNVEHSGPKDPWAYNTPRRKSWEATLTRFVPSTDATPSDDEASGADADTGVTFGDIAAGADVDNTVLVFNAKANDGTAIQGNCHWGDITYSSSDDPDEETLTLTGTGNPTLGS